MKPSKQLNETELARELKKAQAWFRKNIPRDISLADELIAERREEARRETEGK